MRSSHVCPKCDGRRLYVCENRQPDHDSSNIIKTLRVCTVPIDQETTGAEEGSSYRSEIGSFETWICAGCGFTEWYAQDPRHIIQRLATRGGSDVRVIDAAAPKLYR